MKKFTGHKEPWGDFVDVKINSVELLQKEIAKKKPDQVWISGVCDPYQPLEEKYELTRGCLKVLADNNWPFIIQTKSPSVLRDTELLKNARCDVGFSMATADENIKQLFEPRTPKIIERIKALNQLHKAGIKTYAMIAPILPGAEKIIDQLEAKPDYLYIDRMNYNYADKIYKKNKLEDFLDDEYFHAIKMELADKAKKLGIVFSAAF